MASSKQRELSFNHLTFEHNTIKEYKITPFILKEFENRWYVIGIPKNKNEIRTFGIDRISDIKVEKKATLKKTVFKNQLKIFDNLIGLYTDDKKAVKIRLSVNEIHVNYMRSLPLHHSQIIHPKNDKGFHFVDFYLIPNYEFKTLVLKMGDYTSVISPPKLREEIKKMLNDTIKNYL